MPASGNKEIQASTTQSQYADDYLDFQSLIQRSLLSDRDLTDSIETMLRAEASVWHVLFNLSRDGMVIVDHQGKTVDSNPAFAKMLGYDRKEIYNHYIWDWDRNADRDFILRFIDRLGSDGIFVERTHWRKDGSRIDVEVSCSSIYCADKKLVLCSCRDVSERKENERRMQKLVTTDELTGLLNRREFSQRLEQELSRDDRYDAKFAIVMFDIDHFKSINDSYGHHTGDLVLQHISKLAATKIRNVDCICRWGGEEFLMYLPETNTREATAVAEKLRAAIEVSEPKEIGAITASFGVTEVQPGDDLTRLINRADNAMYKAKNSGRNCVWVE